MFNFGEYITVTDAVYITTVSITIVFSILILIALVISGFKNVFKEDTNTKPNITATVQNNNVQKSIVNLNELVSDEDKLVATLVATIAANENDEDKIYKVTKINEI